VHGEVDAENGADAQVGQLAAGTKAVDGLAVDAQERCSLARRDESSRKTLQH
jgi:hypothetical protein